jgi:hypothetical protein
MISQAQKYFNSVWSLCEKAQHDTGVLSDIVFAQSALETGYGKHAPQNNYFGIKGAGGVQDTIEYINGVAEHVQAHFAGFASMDASFLGYEQFLLNNRRYAALRKAGTLNAQLAALSASGYATDPKYAAKVGAICATVPLLLRSYAGPAGIKTALGLTDISIKPIPGDGSITPATVQVKPQETNIMTTNTTAPAYTNEVASILGHNATALVTIGNILKGALSVLPLPAAAQSALVSLGDNALALAEKTSGVATQVQAKQAAAAQATATVVETANVTEASVADTNMPILEQVEADALTAALNFGQGELNKVMDAWTFPGAKAIEGVIEGAEPEIVQLIEGAVLRPAIVSGPGVVQPIAVDPTKP